MSRSRSAAKPQAEQGRRSSSAVISPPAVTEPDDQYIIPGRLTVRQWSNLLIQEETEDVVGEIMSELLSQVMDGCLKSDLKKKMVPFTVNWAKTFLIQAVQENFICRDENEEAWVSSMTEDSAPKPSTVDSWARGCLPVEVIEDPPTPIHQQKEEKDEAAAQRETRAVRLKTYPKQTEKKPRTSKPDLTRKQKHFLPKLMENKQSLSLPTQIKDIESKTIVRSVHHQKSLVIPKLDLSNRWIVPELKIVDPSDSNMSFKKHKNKTDKSRGRVMLYEDQPGQIDLKNGAAMWLGKLSSSCETMDLDKRVSPMPHQTARLSRPQLKHSSLAGVS